MADFETKYMLHVLMHPEKTLVQVGKDIATNKDELWAIVTKHHSQNLKLAKHLEMPLYSAESIEKYLERGGHITRAKTHEPKPLVQSKPPKRVDVLSQIGLLRKKEE